MHEFNQSLRYDQRMWKVDIAGSIAYSKALHKTGILTKEEQEKIADGLTAVGREWEQGTVLRVCLGQESASPRILDSKFA